MPTQRESFKQVQHYANSGLMNKLEYNLKTWFDWALLISGAWTDISGTTVTAYGGDLSVLRLVDDPAYTAGTVYETGRKDWVWETGVDYKDFSSTVRNPISPATIFVNGSPVSPDHINYPLGRVVFSSALASTDVVTASYSYRNVQVYIADDAPWWDELQYRSFRVDDSQFSQTDDGFWSITSNHRVQMPCVVIEAVPRASSRGYQLGDGSAWVEQDVLVHVLANNRRDRNRLVDIFRGQFDTTIWLFDNDLVAAAEDYPLDYRGEIIDSSKTYPYLIDSANPYRWESCRFSRTQVSQVETISTRLHEGIVRLTAEVVLDD